MSLVLHFYNLKQVLLWINPKISVNRNGKFTPAIGLKSSFIEECADVTRDVYIYIYIYIYICSIVFTSKRLPLQPVSSERNHQVADKFRKVSCLNVYEKIEEARPGLYIINTISNVL